MASNELEPTQDRVAIIGMSIRFPGARTPEQFWHNLCAGIESVRTLSDEELDRAGVPAAEYRQPSYVRRKAVLDGADQFDARFFGIPPLEARVMDPQQRLVLECAWQALEHAGYGARAEPSRVGVYCGVGLNTYWLRHVAHDRKLLELLGGWQASILNDKDYVPTRVSYHLNLIGPSVNVNTACSASLVSAHLACQSLLTYECDMAIAGGVTVEFPQEEGVLYREGMVYSPDGHCRTFDAKGRGIVDGNGAGMVVLKRLDEAVRDRDTIHAVIIGSAINNDGSDKVGYTAPSISGQVDVIRQAHAVADCNAATIEYVETHGTATPLGDPIEVSALSEAFRETTDKVGFCGLGSVKSNLGHLDTAAGVAGLIKTVLCLGHQAFVPSLHFEQPNPNIPFDGSPFYVCTEHRPWPASDTPRRAGVTSLGIGGTNAHVVVEEPPPRAASVSRRSHRLLTLSARTETSLRATASALGKYLATCEHDLADVAYTLHVGREPFEHRLIVCSDDRAEASASLDKGKFLIGAAAETPPPVVFMFPGQGSQHLQMARGLYDVEPVVRDQVDSCAELLRPVLDLDLRDIMFSTDDTDAARLQHTALAQPALFTVQYALARLWASWGVTPQAMIGHSIGEYVAACLAGVCSREHALRLVAARGKLMADTAPGYMIAVNQPEAEIAAGLGERVSIAVINEPDWCVLSGPTAAMDAVTRELESAQITHRRLHTSHAFHSATMEPVLDAFMAEVEQCDLQPASTPYISNVTGDWIDPKAPTTAAYWRDHLRNTVRFSDGLATLLGGDQAYAFVEVGPGQTTSRLVKRHPLRDNARVVVASLPHPKAQASDVKTALEALGQLWLGGHPVDWHAVHDREQLHRVPLPTYVFDQRRYWVDPPQDDASQATAPTHRDPDAEPLLYTESWQRCGLARPAASDDADRRWLVFTDRAGLGERIARGLRECGGDIIAVQPGASFERRDNAVFAIDPRSVEHQCQLMGALAQPGVPDQIVHLCGLDRASGRTGNGADDPRYIGFCSLFGLINALAENRSQDDDSEISLTVISRNLQSVTGREALAIDDVAMRALVSSAIQEHPWLRVRCVDVSDDELGRADWLAARLVDEIRSFDAAATVAYRGTKRWLASVQPIIRLRRDAGPPAALKPRGRYLVTGGATDIGLAVAERLAARACARLLLIADVELPPKADWAALAADPDADATRRRLVKRLLTIEERGGEVAVATGYIEVPGELARCVALADEALGGVDGVVHAASPDDSALLGELRDLRADEMCDFLDQRAAVLPALEAALDGLALDFCLIFSSLSSVLGGRGMAGYAAGNLQADTFVKQHNQRSEQTWTAVNWDRWLDGPRGAGRDSSSLTSDEALEALERLLGYTGLDQIVVASDLTARIARAAAPPDTRDRHEAEINDVDQPEVSDDRPDLPTAYVAPSTEAEQQIAAIWSELLGIRQIGVHDNFFDLGGHSLLATRFLVRVREQLDVTIALGEFFAESTVAGLAALVGDATAAHSEADELSALLSEIEGMSEEQAVAALEAENLDLDEPSDE